MREHSLFFIPFLSNYFQIGKINYERPPLALLSPGISVLEPRLTDEDLYLIPDFVWQASIPLREAAPYLLS